MTVCAGGGPARIIEDVSSDIARYILGKLDPAKKKTDMPVKPIITEFFGIPKAGKDTQLVHLDRWFRRRGYQVLIHQESAETEEIRTMSRGVDPYTYEMRHFSYTFANFVSALTSRDFHLIALNRGFVDTLCWLEWHRRNGALSDIRYNQFRSYILGGPWVEAVDGVFYLTCSVEVALKREYGNNPNPVYGSRMNPKTLALMKDCIDSVVEDVSKELPELPLFVLDTSESTAEGDSHRIISILLNSVKERLDVTDDEVTPFSPALLRLTAKDAGRQELKFSGTVDTQKLLHNGWHPESSGREVDTYLAPKNQPALQGDECFHIRQYGSKKCYFIYKRRVDSPTRSRVSIPVLYETLGDFFTVFDKIAVVEKDREVFVKNDIILTLDRVEGLGEFVELRAPLAADITAEAIKLGLTQDRLVPETYIRLVLKNQSS